MANTTNFGWETPDDTDLVKDGAAAIRTLGSAIDASLGDLEGGTTGQILAKNSNTDMDFIWIANDQGDITGITASSPLTGGGTTGAITVGIQDGTTAQKGAVQLENSTSSTSTTTAAVPASVKSAYDLANAAIPKSLVDAAGDLIYATANDTPARLALGTAGQVLTVNSGATAPEWKTASSSSALTLVKSQTIGSGVSSVSVSSAFSSTYDNYMVIIYGGSASGNENLLLTLGSTTSGYYRFAYFGEYSASTLAGNNTSNGASFRCGRYGTNGMAIKLEIYRPYSSARTSFTGISAPPQTDGAITADSGFLNDATSYTAFTLTCGGSTTLTGGEIKVYGYSNS